MVAASPIASLHAMSRVSAARFGTYGFVWYNQIGPPLVGPLLASTSRSGFFLALVPPARFERAACGLGIRRSVQLSYGGGCMSRQPAPDRCGERGEG